MNFEYSGALIAGRARSMFVSFLNSFILRIRFDFDESTCIYRNAYRPFHLFPLAQSAGDGGVNYHLRFVREIPPTIRHAD